MTPIPLHVRGTCLTTRALARPHGRSRLACSPLLQHHPHARNFRAQMRRSKLRTGNDRLDTDPRTHDVEQQDVQPRKDPRLNDLGKAIEDDFALIKYTYGTPKNPIVLAHGLMGFDELRLAGSVFPGVQYWRGITEAMRANSIEVITASVPASGSIEERAAKLGADIAAKAAGKSVNIIAHSMGGLDARYMISRLRPAHVRVLSLTTVATPHRGSAFADFVFDEIGDRRLPAVYKLAQSFGFATGAFSQLTRRYMRDEFNPNTPNDPRTRYFSYGATANPGLWSAFRRPHRVVQREEGANDGLVSVESARWGTYKGTLVGVSHLDLINWTNRLRWLIWRMTGNKRNFNAIAFYLGIADMLKKEGL